MRAGASSESSVASFGSFCDLRRRGRLHAAHELGVGVERRRIGNVGAHRLVGGIGKAGASAGAGLDSDFVAALHESRGAIGGEGHALLARGGLHWNGDSHGE